MGDDVRARFGVYRGVREAGEAGAYWARAFGRLLERHRRDDGSVWSYAAIERATGGLVPRPYCSDLAGGRISEPGFSKVWAITLALGADIGEWTDWVCEEAPEA